MLSVWPSIRRFSFRCFSTSASRDIASNESGRTAAEPLPKKPISFRLTTSPSRPIRIVTSRFNLNFLKWHGVIVLQRDFRVGGLEHSQLLKGHLNSHRQAPCLSFVHLSGSVFT